MNKIVIKMPKIRKAKVKAKKRKLSSPKIKKQKDESVAIFDSTVGSTKSLFISAPKKLSSFKNLFNSLLAGLIVAGLFSATLYALAVPPTSKYTFSEILNPSCTPGSTNCSVEAPAVYSFSSNNFSGTGSFSGGAITGTSFIIGANTISSFVNLSSLAGLSIVQGDLLYGSGTNTLLNLVKSGTAGQYLSNGGTSNNPAWAALNQAAVAGLTTSDSPTFAGLGLGSGNLTTTGTIGAGAITGTSFIIGVNTLTTTEWAFLDGINQTVATTSSPTFVGLTLSGLTTTRVLYSVDDVLTDSANLTFDGTTLTAGGFTTTGAIGGGAITGTSFIIGANTLTTTEWAFLDGINQTVATTSSPSFVGITATGTATLGDATTDIHGINTAAVANQMLTASIASTTNVSSYFINGTQTNNSNANHTKQTYGYYLNQDISGTDAPVTPVSTNSFGIYLDIDDTSTVIDGTFAARHNVYGIYSDVNFGGTNTSNLSFGTYAGYFINGGNMGTAGTAEHYGLYSTVSGTADTNYGIYADASGATTNYAGYFSGRVYNTLTESTTGTSVTAVSTTLVHSAPNSTAITGYGYYLSHGVSGTDTGAGTNKTSYGYYADVNETSTINNAAAVHKTYAGYFDVNWAGTNTDNNTLAIYGGYFTATGTMGTTDSTSKYGIYSIVTGTADTNYGIYADASGATTNYAGYFSGNVYVTGGAIGVGVAPDSTKGLGVTLTASNGQTVYGSYNTVATAGTSSPTGAYGTYNVVSFAGGNSGGIMGVYNSVTSTSASSESIYGTYSTMTPQGTGTTMYGEYITSATAVTDPSVLQVGLGIYWNGTGTDTSNKKWAIYNGSTSTTAGKVFLGLDSTKTYWGTGFDASIYYDGSNLVINPKEVGTGVVSLGDAGLTTTGAVTGGSFLVGATPGIDGTTCNDITVVKGIVTAGTCTSDVRFKDITSPLENVLEKLDNIRGVYYTLNETYRADKAWVTADSEIGMIAQEVEAQFPELVTTNERGYKAIKYSMFTSVLVEAIKELNQKINILGGGSVSLNQLGTTGTGEISGVQNTSISQSLITLGMTIVDGVATLKEVITDKFTAKTARIEKIEMVDSATGDIYCTQITNGEWTKAKGECASTTVVTAVAESPVSDIPIPSASSGQVEEIVQQVTEQVTQQITEQQQATQQVVQEAAQQAVDAQKASKKSVREIKEEIKQEVKQELKQEVTQQLEAQQQEPAPEEIPAPVVEETPVVEEIPVETPAPIEDAPSVGDIIQESAAGLLNSMWEFLKGITNIGKEKVSSLPIIQKASAGLLQIFNQAKKDIEVSLQETTPKLIENSSAGLSNSFQNISGPLQDLWQKIEKLIHK